MKIPLDLVINATRAHFSHVVATSLPAALRCMYGLEQLPAEIEDTCLGEAILRAALNVFSDVEPIPLERVQLILPNGSRMLSAEDAAGHALVGPWIEETLSAAVAAPITAGARASNLAMGSPTFAGVQLSELEGRLAGMAVMQFEVAPDTTCTAAAIYGAFGQGGSLVKTFSFCGTALFRIGADAGALPLPQAVGLNFGPDLLAKGAGSGAVH